ncbi:hypothetical protein [Fundicoccus ignavus]|nr:hypothetical protein [Fundicoccus ignavus]
MLEYAFMVTFIASKVNNLYVLRYVKQMGADKFLMGYDVFVAKR